MQHYEFYTCSGSIAGGIECLETIGKAVGEREYSGPSPYTSIKSVLSMDDAYNNIKN